MSKIISNISYILYVIILLYYMWLVSFPQYLNIDAQKNYDEAQETVISYTHKK